MTDRRTSQAAERATILLTASAALSIFLTACRGEPGPGRYQVRGTVTYAGRPVPHGTVMFFPIHGQVAASPIAADGRYQLTTIAGTHRVAVIASPDPPEDADPRTYVSPPPLVPSRYERPETSRLVANVPARQDTMPVVIDIRLKR